MSNMKKIRLLVAAIIIMGYLFTAHDTVYAGTRSVTIDLTGGSNPVRRPAKLNKAKRVKISNNKKSVVKVKYIKSKRDRRIEFTGKKTGNARVRVKCYLNSGKTKTYTYKVKVKKSRKKTDIEYAKEAFEIQNGYRAEKNIPALQWSDELYEFCLYRLKTSGYDSHNNLMRDIYGYFGNFAGYNQLIFAENLYSGSRLPEKAMKGWKGSPGHYNNLMNSNHVCGAIAVYGVMWCAVFYDGNEQELVGWDQHQIRKINVRRFDDKTSTYLSTCDFAYYEDGKKKDTMKVARITDPSGKAVYLEVGKTYIFYERIAPVGFSKAAGVKINIATDIPDEVILK